MAPRRAAIAALLLVVAAASLLLPEAPSYDAWAWLTWGRELAGLELATGAGPSWKPLPVILTTAFSAFGDAAPELWLLVIRAAGLAALLLAFSVARRLAADLGRNPALLAGVLAALALLLLEDRFTPWSRQIMTGLGEPLLVALVLLAIDRELEGRRGQALAAGFGAALLRPEAWPLLAVWALWATHREPRLRAPAIAVGLAIPLLWFVPDLVASGDALSGAAQAREGTGAPPGELLEVLERSSLLVLPAIWAGAVVELLLARRQRTVVTTLGLGALGWIAVVAVMAAFGYAGLPRFVTPAAAVACVLGGVGLVRLAALALRGGRAADGTEGPGRVGRPPSPPGPLLAGLAVGLGIWALVGASLRAAQLPDDLAAISESSRGNAELEALAAGLERPIEACGGAVATGDFLYRTAIAWQLERPIAEVRFATRPARGELWVSSAPDLPAAAGGVAKAESGRWSAYAIGCTSGSDAG